MAAKLVVLLLGVTAVSARVAAQVVYKLDDGPRFQYVEAHGQLHLVDMWVKQSDLAEAARYSPDSQNIYHLFTRQNPAVSQPLLMGNAGLLGSTNYNPNRRTAVIFHGWLDNALGDVNTVLVPAFLAAEDMNVIVVDWGAGANTINYVAAVRNTVPSGEAVARFIRWLNAATGATPAQYHLVGHSLGAHQAGVVGRNLNGEIAYIHALDPALPGFATNDDKFRSSDGVYTEVIHTNAGVLGYLGTLGDVDFYPNGGINMAGCDGINCDHDRCFHYLAESLISGGFRGTRCATFVGAMAGNCFLWGSLNMGGLVPKTGQSGIFYLETNSSPPFSRG
ncbi:lipase domain-containing protein [Phthorimaea operculella]|nr:lipase domain-containing protein [Phthorimaea operculella]